MASTEASTSRIRAEQLPVAPTEPAKPPGAHLVHNVFFEIPVPSVHLAQTLYRAISVDRVLRPAETFVAYSVPECSDKNATFCIAIHAATVRILRLSINSVLENVTLILETMQAFAPEFKASSIKSIASTAGKAIDAKDQSSVPATGAAKADERVTNVPPSEFELNGTGRAG